MQRRRYRMPRENGPLFGASVLEVNAFRVRKDMRILQIVLSLALKVQNVRCARKQLNAAVIAIETRSGSHKYCPRL